MTATDPQPTIRARQPHTNPPRSRTIGPLTLGTAIIATTFTAAIFGFFYAWTCSTMWGLDTADPHVAIEAMRAMNASVRNAVFAPVFFGTPAVLAVAALSAHRAGARGRWFGAAALLYLIGGLGLTMAVNVPMNETLATAPVPESRDAAQQMWDTYSQPWQVANAARTAVSGLALVLAATGLYDLGRCSGRRRASVHP